MTYGRFIAYNVVGGLVWTAGFTFLGYYFGNIPVVRDNFSLVVVAIILISVVPIVYELVSSRQRRHREGDLAGPASSTEPTGE
jgi:membrane-associated protein